VVKLGRPKKQSNDLQFGTEGILRLLCRLHIVNAYFHLNSQVIL